MNERPIHAADAFAPRAESVLSFADEPIPELRKRIELALRYTFSWDKALSQARGSLAYGTVDPLLTEWRALEARVSAMQTALRILLDQLPVEGVFVGNDQKAMYEATSATWAQLYTDLSLSLATLPQRPLIDQLGDLGSAVFSAPVAAATVLAEKVTGSVRDLLGGTAAAIWNNLWPWLLLAGGVGLAYLFRAPLMRAVGKAAA